MAQLNEASLAADAGYPSEYVIARFVIERFSRENKYVSVPNPDEAAFLAAGIPESQQDRISCACPEYVAILDTYMDAHCTSDWRMLMSMYASEQYICKQLRQPVDTKELDGVAKERAFGARSELILEAPKVRKSIAEFAEIVFGGGSIGKAGEAAHRARVRNVVDPSMQAGSVTG